MGVQIDIENGKVTDYSFTFGGKLESFVGPVIFAVGGSVDDDDRKKAVREQLSG